MRVVFQLLSLVILSLAGLLTPEYTTAQVQSDPESLFKSPPATASPGVLWMWMGNAVSKAGIRKDLEALKKAGFNRTTLFSLADVTTPWAGEIGNSPTGKLIAWTEPWWKLVRYAAEESKRLGMDFGMFNGPGYESSGGKWITPELSMQELCWSSTTVNGDTARNIELKKPTVNPRANMLWPIYNPNTGKVEKPEMNVRKTYYKDIVVLAAPASGTVSTDSVIDLSKYLQPDGKLYWSPPPGRWTIYRIGHTSMATLIQPAQWEATGMECDKMSQTAVDFHIGYVIKEIKKHLGPLAGTVFSHVHFDSYEAGTPGWTPLMRQEFSKRRGYDLLPYLLCFAGRKVQGTTDSTGFRKDFSNTITDLHRDIYFPTLRKRLNQAGLQFMCEPYGGPWKQDEILPYVERVMTEFWTNKGVYTPYELDPTVAAMRKSGQRIVEAEAFTGLPADSKWNETPEWLKPIGDAAFCAGVNRLVLHRFVHQPWAERFQPGMTMGQWGTHFDRTQTWWKEFPAMVGYWKRCQALLQWGELARDSIKIVENEGQLDIRSIGRKANGTSLYFVANVKREWGKAAVFFPVKGMIPETWDPVTGEMEPVPYYKVSDGGTECTLHFASGQSFFIVFRKPLTQVKATNIKAPAFTYNQLNGPWQVSFDTSWGGPAGAVRFDSLTDWTKNPVPGIRYYSGTAVYRMRDAELDAALTTKGSLLLELGVVKHLAHVYLNGKDMGVLWTAPWQLKIPPAYIHDRDNLLEIHITNTWSNRLIGDEQEPDDAEWLPGHEGGRFLKAYPDWFVRNVPRPSRGRFCFTSWNYFDKNSALIPAGLLGPVMVIGKVQ